MNLLLRTGYMYGCATPRRYCTAEKINCRQPLQVAQAACTAFSATALHPDEVPMHDTYTSQTGAFRARPAPWETPTALARSKRRGRPGNSERDAFASARGLLAASTAICTRWSNSCSTLHTRRPRPLLPSWRQREAGDRRSGEWSLCSCGPGTWQAR